MRQLVDTALTVGVRKGPTRISPFVGLHCSGADGSQWSSLMRQVGCRAATLSPDLIGTPSRGHREGGGSFSLAQEAIYVIELIEDLVEPVHLVGHSYGGALALHIARARPDLVRSLCLFEPTLFSLLETGGERDRLLRTDIVTLAAAIRSGIADGNRLFGAQLFSDFWGGVGAWQALSRIRREALVDWIEKAPLDFDALLNEAEPECILRSNVPSTVIVGGVTHPHTRHIADLLLRQSTLVRIRSLAGAGHLGPFTLREPFEKLVLSHIIDAESFRTAWN